VKSKVRVDQLQVISNDMIMPGAEFQSSIAHFLPLGFVVHEQRQAFV
jgi:hypothetical protein